MNETDTPSGAMASLPIERRALLQSTLLGMAALAAGLPVGVTQAAPSVADAAQRALTGRAWEDFCDSLKQAGRVIDNMPKQLTAVDRTEWYRYLSRLARNGLERFIENADPDRPQLRMNAWRTSMNVTNPDQDHFMFELDPRYDYVVTGNRGSVPYFIVAVWTWAQPADTAARDWAPRGVAGLQEFNPAIARSTAFLQSDNMQFDTDGGFALRLSQHHKEGNWLKLAPENTGMLIRTVFHERSKELPATFEIKRVGEVTPGPMEPEALSLGLARAAQQVVGYAELARVWSQDIFGGRPNLLRFSRKLYLGNGGVADRHFGFGIWERANSEALVLEFTPPDCEYWIFQLCNIWQENLDNYEDGQGYLTKFTARPEASGAIRIVVSDQDPGIGGNWVDAYQHVSGLMGLRLIKTSEVPQVKVHRVTLDALRSRGWDALNTKPAILSELVE